MLLFKQHLIQGTLERQHILLYFTNDAAKDIGDR
jgi:hypothetical protein